PVAVVPPLGITAIRPAPVHAEALPRHALLPEDLFHVREAGECEGADRHLARGGLGGEGPICYRRDGLLSGATDSHGWMLGRKPVTWRPGLERLAGRPSALGPGGSALPTPAAVAGAAGDCAPRPLCGSEATTNLLHRASPCLPEDRDGTGSFRTRSALSMHVVGSGTPGGKRPSVLARRRWGARRDP